MDAKSAVFVLAIAASACARKQSSITEVSSSEPPGAVPVVAALATGEKACVVHLHGKSGKGAPISVSGGITHVRPDGNAPGWGGLEWLYFPEARYEEVRAIVSRAIADAGCKRVLVHGFSNGGAAAGKLFCRGERFGGTVVGYVLDDPVPDHGVEPCTPAAGVKLRVYWSGGLAVATDGWQCSSADWTCEGDSTIGIERYTKLLGTVPTPSIHTKHEEYVSPPEYRAWW